jgi:hypothetical protein
VARYSAKADDRDNEVQARDVLVRALLAQHRDADAVSAANELQRIQRSTDGNISLPARITVARALVTQKTTASSALADLRAIAAEAHQKSFLMHELNAKLALVEGEKLQGKQPNATALNALATQARSKGYLLIARKSSSLIVDR